MHRTMLLAVLLGGGSPWFVVAQEGAPSPLCPVPIGMDAAPLAEVPAPAASAWPWALPFVRETRYGARPNVGSSGSPTHGYDHYDLPSKHYGLWFRPSAAAEDECQHCRSRPFAPKGYGWANRRTGFEIDYHPYVVRQLPSVHGPSYYYRQPRSACPCLLQGCKPTLDGQN
jgi:hypothetical protein